MSAWIEKSDGSRVAIETNCYFGRAHANTVQLQSPGASRRHAHLHAQRAEGGTEYWIADLGSTNGTLRNGKRVTIPCRLKDGDVITIMDEGFVFRTAEEAANASLETTAPPTELVRASQQCWLLMVDIKRYTNLSRQLDTDTLSLKVGTWLRQCRDAIEGAGGVVDKFLGDAIFAYWKHSPEAPDQVAGALAAAAPVTAPARSRFSHRPAFRARDAGRRRRRRQQPFRSRGHLRLSPRKGLLRAPVRLDCQRGRARQPARHLRLRAAWRTSARRFSRRARGAPAGRLTSPAFRARRRRAAWR